MLLHASTSHNPRQTPRCRCALAVVMAATVLFALLTSGSCLAEPSADSRVDAITLNLARAFNSGRLDAPTYARLFHLRTEAAELALRASHFRDTGDRRAVQATYEAEAALAVLARATEGVE